MFKKLLTIRYRTRTSKLGRLLKKLPEPVNNVNDYRVLNSFTSELNIDGLYVSHYKIGDHLRGLMEYDDHEDVDLVKRNYEKICEAISNELRTLPSYDQECYRYSGLNNIDVYEKKIKVGDLVMDRSFLSSSIFRGPGGKAHWMLDHPETKADGNFIIRSKSGKYIQDISPAKNEHEVLFDKQTVFKITDIIRCSKKAFLIFMEEVDINKEKYAIKDIYSGDLMN